MWTAWFRIPWMAGLQTFREGPPEVLGLNAESGAQTAVYRINDAGGVAGRDIELEVVEEAGAAIENYTRFVDEVYDGRPVPRRPRVSRRGRWPRCNLPAHPR